MNVTVKPIKEKSQAELKVSVPAHDFAPYIERAGKKLTQASPLPGFRPGKAPLPAVIATFGQERVLHEALELALPHFFVQAALDQGVEAINRPSVAIDTLNVNEPFEFTATVDVLPEVTIGDISKVKAERKPVEATEAEIEQELKYVAKMRAKPLEVVRGAAKGDVATVDFAVRVSGAVIEGGESKNHPVQLGDGHFVPGFEEGLLGIRAGEARTFEIQFPADYAQAAVAGQKAQVEVAAHSVQQMILPALDDTFAKGLGKFENLEDLKKKLRENIQHEKEHKEVDRLRRELMEKLAEGATFGFIPDVLIDREIDARLQEFAQMLAVQQRSIGDYLAREKKTLEQVRADMRVSAEKAVKVGLAMRAFAEAEKIEVTDEEMEAKAQEYLQQFKDPEAAAKEVDMAKLRDDVTLVIRNQKALEKLEERVGLTPLHHEHH